VYLGMDIGSVSLNLVLLDSAFRVRHEEYVRTLGRPLETALEALDRLTTRVPLDEIEGVALTGGGTVGLAELYGMEPVNEIIAHARAVEALCPEVRTILEIGGEDSKVILLAEDDETGRLHIRDFAMNTLCAAGTGSFLDQQASRLGVSIEDEWGRMALQCTRVPRIAGRCSVFAKSDMIHLQQEGTPAEDIVAGLCFAMARNLVAVVGKGKEFRPQIAFQGGVAANAGMVRAFTEILGLAPGELLIPEHFASMGAIGAVLVDAERERLGRIPSLGPIRQRLSGPSSAHVAAHRPLKDDGYPIATEPEALDGNGECIDVFVGVDVGSISTNVVAVDSDGHVLAREYLMTAGRPLAAVTDALYRVGSTLEERADGGVRVRGCATTGSGRYLTGDFIGADAVRNEITAHATGAAFIRPDVETVFDIGGQDSKYISLKNGVVVDFTMNKVCAAGTGSFIEEQSERLGVGLKTGEFGKLALSADEPTLMGDRCTVFMETDVNRKRNQGAPVDDLCAGLCYSIVSNYLDKVVAGRPVGQVVLFQGGTAYNRGIKSAMERVLEREIVVPPHHDVMGAVGMALIARDWYAETRAETEFKGFDLRDVRYEFDAFECQDCPNACEIHVVKIGEGDQARELRYGSRCGKFDETERGESESALPKPFAERQRLLDQAYSKRKPDSPNGRTVGVPKMTHTWEFLPMWRALFTEAGFQVITSSRTNRTLIQSGIEEVAAETCFPIKVSHGHIRDLINKGVDYVFLPTIVDMHDDTGKSANSFTCPYVQAVPYMAKAGMEDVDWDSKLVAPVLHFAQPERAVRRDLENMLLGLGVERPKAQHAIDVAFQVQNEFGEALRRRGKEILDGVGNDELALVVISRSYNGCDPGLNMHIPDKLRNLGCLPIPLDMLPIDEGEILDDYPFMYWKYGTRILSAARIVAGDDRLYPVYITNFGCGPDSFIMKFVERELRGKPCLTLEVDEHSADAGIITRCEAFLDSLSGARQNAEDKVSEPFAPAFAPRPNSGDGRSVYIPYMDDHGYAVSAAMRASGVDARQMPMSNEQSRTWGRRYTSGKECYPCVVTTGDILRQINSPDFDRDATAFFMPTAYGPCRFGQYCRFHRMVLDDLGYHDVPMVLLDQTQEYYKDADKLGPDFRKLAWRGVVFVDALQKMLRETRPYEVVKGETDEVYRRYLHRCAEITEERGDLITLAREARWAFESVEVDRSRPRPLIGIVGEIFVRSNEFVNNFIVRKIEAFGAEVVMPPFEEWLNYIGWSRKREARKQGNWKLLATEKLSEVIQRREKRKVLKEFRGAIRGSLEEPPSEEVIRLASDYLDPSVRGGETILSLGRSMEYVHANCDGIVNLHPFNCMPGAIVNAILTRLQKDYDIPVLKVAYDGQEQSNELIRIEAFVHQCRERMVSRAGPRPRRGMDERVEDESRQAPAEAAVSV
jgi:predicted CoA-substrate-specific enzyme activase